MNTERNLSRSILETIAYYDVFSYPLTAFEIWKHLVFSGGEEAERPEAGLREVMDSLDDERLSDRIGSDRGFYFLKGRQALVRERIRRNKVSEEKFRKIIRTAKRLRFVPFVRMIGVTGRVAMRNAKAKSDLDLFVILENGRIFTGRLLLTGLVQALGIRRHGRHIADRICLNHFVAVGSEEILVKDLFASSEYAFMVPVFGREEYRSFIERNGWIRGFRPNFPIEGQSDLRTLEDSWLSASLRRLGETVLGSDRLERRLGAWQCRRIGRNPQTEKEGSMVFASEAALVFLPEPQGPKVFELFKRRLEGFGRDFRAGI